MAVNSCEESPDAFCISVFPDENTTDPQYESPLTFSSHSEIVNPLYSQIYLDAQMNCQSNSNTEMENADAYIDHVLDVGIDTGNLRMPKTNDETVEKLKIEEMLKTEGSLTRALHRQISLPVGEKLVKLLMNDRFVLPKFTSTDKSTTERLHETPTYRARKYKRSTSFSSRKVVLLFSVLSSLGTMVLIYLTLRVRQLGDNYLHA